LLYLFKFSHSTANFVLTLINFIFGLIFIISYKFPDILRLNRKKQFKDILKYNKILQLNFKDTKAWNNKGTEFSKIGRYHEAIKCFDKVLKIDTKDGAS